MHVKENVKKKWTAKKSVPSSPLQRTNRLVLFKDTGAVNFENDIAHLRQEWHNSKIWHI
jgi:hypothetical protein